MGRGARGKSTTTEEVISPPKEIPQVPLELNADAGLEGEYMAWKKTQNLERKAASEKKHSMVYENVCTFHHLSVAAASCYVLYLGPSKWPSVFLVACWWIYSDFYSSLLHCVLDDPKCLKIPGVAPVAKGFQDHHHYPMESTAGKGLRMLCDDTVRIQWVTGGFSLLFSAQRDRTTLVLILLKWITCAYGTQVGHYYAHCAHVAPQVVKFLQRLHILLPPSQHWKHHKAPYETNFGIVNGLTNHHINPVHLRSFSFAACFGLWCLMSMFDIAIWERFVTV